MADNEKEQSKSKLNPKIFIIGVPLFIIQLVVVYMIAANLVMSKMKSEGTYVEEMVEQAEDTTKAMGEFIYTLDDVIVNPAGTDGQRLLMASLGFDVGSEEQLKEIEDKQIVLKDMIISTFSEKTLSELSQIGYKDSLKQILAENVSGLMPKVKINTVYFSKYIIQ